MVDRGNDIEFKLAVGGRLKDSRVDLDLFNPGTVESAKGSYYPCFLAGAAGTIDKEVGKVGALGLEK